MRLKTVIILVALSVLSLDMSAQCAMCKAVLESEQTFGGPAVSGGINDGILYLMAFPYTLIAGFLIFNYKSELRKMLSDAF
jgi:hypothetical protein